MSRCGSLLLLTGTVLGQIAPVIRLVVVVLTLCAFQSVSGQSQPLASDEETLRGIEYIRVVVEELSHSAKQNGLTEGAVKTAVELRLRSLGLPVWAAREIPPMTPYLYVNINIVCLNDPPFCAMYIRLNVKQVVGNSNGLFSYASTWSTGSNLITGARALRSNWQRDLIEQVDLFANDYLAANPKK